MDTMGVHYPASMEPRGSDDPVTPAQVSQRHRVPELWFDSLHLQGILARMTRSDRASTGRFDGAFLRSLAGSVKLPTLVGSAPAGTLRAIQSRVVSVLRVEEHMSTEMFGPESGVTTLHGVDSWTSLVATTLGLDALGRLRIVVRARSVGIERGRLVVQAFAKADCQARPLAAAQRAVSREELLQGVELSLHPEHCDAHTSHHVLAWIEPGEPDLEFDGLRASPSAPVSLGRVRALRDRAEIELRPFAA